MKKLLLLSLLLLAVMLGSCYKESDGLTPGEKALVGTWKYDKVKYYESLFNNQNITNQYADVSLEFKPDKSLIYHEASNQIEGKWRLDEIYTPCIDPDANCTTSMQFRLLIMLLQSGEIEESVWESVNMSKRELSATEQEGRSGKYYYYELRKD